MDTNQIESLNIQKEKLNIWGEMLEVFTRTPRVIRLIVQVQVIVILYMLSLLVTFKHFGPTAVCGVTTGAEVSLSIIPDKAIITTNTQEFQLNVSSAVPIGFAHIEINFDREMLNLVDFPTINGPLTRTVSMSSIEDANNSGKIVLVLALEPTLRNNPPEGNFSLGSLSFVSVTPAENQTTTISFNDDTTYVVKTDTQNAIFSSYGSTVTINPVEEPPVVPPTEPPTEPPIEPPIEEPSLIGSCSEYCSSIGHNDGLCRKNSGQCKKYKNFYDSEGNVYCTEELGGRACCCN